MRFDFKPANKRAPQTPREDSEIHAITDQGNVAHTPFGRRIAVIGTAGRDKSKPMTAALWEAMCEDLRQRVNAHDHLISGGAAWADHLAVHAMLNGWVKSLDLYLPAPIWSETGFDGPARSASSAANFYHKKFSQLIGVNTIQQILDVMRLPGVNTQSEFPTPGYGAMFARNKKVATACNSVIAYTFGQGDEPADGGTLNTWKQINADERTHVPLDSLLPPKETKQLTRSLKADAAPKAATTGSPRSAFSFRPRA